MSRLLGLQKGCIYGPINSRRLGSSLGINLLPSENKVCPFNCIYCQYGFTPPKGFKAEPGAIEFPDIDKVISELKEALEEFPSVSYITFSGNGEPTLHPKFPKIVDAVNEIRDKMAPHAKTAILSNSAFVNNENIRHALDRLDRRFMKLDAGNELTFKRFNRPRIEIDFNDIISGFKKLNNVIIQSLFAGGERGNASPVQIKAWAEKIGEIRPLECHIYSIDRPVPEKNITLLSKHKLMHIKDSTESETGIPVKVY